MFGRQFTLSKGGLDDFYPKHFAHTLISIKLKISLVLEQFYLVHPQLDLNFIKS
jgi:hypothetical protein